MRIKIIALVTLALLALIIVLWSRRSQSQRALKHGQQTVQSISGYSDNAAYYDSLLAAAHHDAFTKAYTPSITTKARSSTDAFSETAYSKALLEAMIRKATTDGRTDIERQLRETYRNRFGDPPS